MQFKACWEKPILYDGKNLRPHFLLEQFGLLGDAIVAFEGPCAVELSEMVDVEDVLKDAPIRSDRMVHFLGEWFWDSLTEGILTQYLLIGAGYEWLLETKGSLGFSRKGNDLFFQGRKLSVSIVTKTPVSVLFHWALNVETTGTPIPTAGLSELGIEPKTFVEGVFSRWSQDEASRSKARVKVRPKFF